MRGVKHEQGQEVYGKSVHHLLNFIINLKQLLRSLNFKESTSEVPIAVNFQPDFTHIYKNNLKYELF